MIYSWKRINVNCENFIFNKYFRKNEWNLAFIKSVFRKINISNFPKNK